MKTKKMLIGIFIMVVLFLLYGGYQYVLFKQHEKQSELRKLQWEKENKKLTKDEIIDKRIGELDPNKEEENIKIDEYNFQQLEKVKMILTGTENQKYSFKHLKEFNTIYNSNISPIKNCYYLNSSNGKEKYIFGFKLESKKYISLEREIYFVYPRYDIPEDIVCAGFCSDDNRSNFEHIISNPCKD